jgi:hypothetical protein
MDANSMRRRSEFGGRFGQMARVSTDGCACCAQKAIFSPVIVEVECQKNEHKTLNQEKHSKNNWDRECRRDRRTEQQQTDQEIYRPRMNDPKPPPLSPLMISQASGSVGGIIQAIGAVFGGLIGGAVSERRLAGVKTSLARLRYSSI